MSQTQNLNNQATDSVNRAADQRNQNQNQIAELNLNRMGEKHGLTGEDGEEFINFAYENGYTDADFIDAELVMRLGDQFTAVRNMPEFDRMRDRIKKRTAWTGNLGPTPAGEGVAPPQESPEEATLQRLAGRAPTRQV